MNKRNFKSIITAVSTTIVGISGFTLISPVKTNAFETTPESIKQTSETQLVATNSASVSQEFITTKIYQHTLDNKTAATVYFQGLPFLTFVDSPQEKPESNSTNNSFAKAQKLAQKLDNLAQNKIDANKINVNWDNKTSSYSIKLDKEELVSINSEAILPDTTKNLEVDALQATNRLRRLLGNAAPLKEVAGKPKKLVVAKNVSNASAGVKSKRRGYRGIASWYGPGFHGRRTASGERFNQNAYTAAHRSLPFGTKVRVTNNRNGRSVIVRINDRGPFSGGRIIDLSRGAAGAIGLLRSGTAPVTVQVLR